jgi:thioredoxin-like negative regulator of GroEL
MTNDRSEGTAAPALPEIRDALARESVPLLYFTDASPTEARRLQDPAVFMLNAEFEGRVTVIRRDIGGHRDLAAAFGIESAPATLVVNHAGRVHAINRGVAPLDTLRRQVLDARSREWRRQE